MQSGEAPAAPIGHGRGRGRDLAVPWTSGAGTGSSWEPLGLGLLDGVIRFFQFLTFVGGEIYNF